MINEFQKEYSEYWKCGSEISTADYPLQNVYAMRDRRLAGEEIDLIETVWGDDFWEETKKDMIIYTGKEEINKKFIRFKHKLYEKTEKLSSSYVVKDGLVSTYTRPDNFDAVGWRYIRNASETAVVLGALLSVWLPHNVDTLLDRSLNLLSGVLIMAVPVVAVAYLMFKRAKAGQKRRKADEERRHAEAQSKFDKKKIPVVYEEVMGVIDTQVKMIHYADDAAEVTHIKMKEPERILKKYRRIIDCSVGEAEFGTYKKEGRVESLPVKATVYMLRSNGKTLVPEKERVKLLLERKGLDWKITEYSTNK